MPFCINKRPFFSVIPTTSSRNQPIIYLFLLVILSFVIQTAHHGTLLVTKGQGLHEHPKKKTLQQPWESDLIQGKRTHGGSYEQAHER